MARAHRRAGDTRTSTQHGYGHAHQQRVRQLRRAHVDGTPCRRCGKPMWSWQALDGGHPAHAPVSTGSLPDALEHASCNRAAGAHVTNARRRANSATRRAFDWA